MIDKDGHFITHLLINTAGILSPFSLSYDVNTHHLWVGSMINNNICVLKCLSPEDAMTDNHPGCPDMNLDSCTRTVTV